MILAVASGKGGTGKTTVSVNLARVWADEVQLLDCDVEAPNAHLFLAGETREETVVSIPVPVVDEALCDGCGECSRFCAFHAIVSFGGPPVIFPEMCHGCGGCMKVCPRKAISESGKRIGVVEKKQAGHIALAMGRLDVGAAMSPPLIRAVRQYSEREGGMTIIDAPPGTSCPVIAAVRETDYVLLVTEPTPFGLYDLKLAVETMRRIGLPFGVVINRSGIGDDRIHRYCKKETIPVLLEIPDDRRIAEAYSSGHVIVDVLPDYRDSFAQLAEKIGRETAGKGAEHAYI